MYLCPKTKYPVICTKNCTDRETCSTPKTSLMIWMLDVHCRFDCSSENQGVFYNSFTVDEVKGEGYFDTRVFR